MSKYSKILEDLYNGNIKPSEEKINSQEYDKIKIKSMSLSNEILESLNSKNKEMFYKYTELQSYLQSIDSEKQFIKGFSLAIKIIIGSCGS